MAGTTPYVAVVGPGSPDRDAETAAEAVGHALAAAGAVLVCGGLGGVMAAACRGAKRAHGTTVGLLPGTSRTEANPWVDVALPTGMGELRNGLVVRAADAVIAVGGGYGTLSEIALALKAGVPVVGISTWVLPPPARRDAVVQASDPEEAVRTALELAAGRLTR